MTISISYRIAPKLTKNGISVRKYQFIVGPSLYFCAKMTPKKRNRNLTSQIYQSQIQQSTSSGSDPDQKVRNSRILEFFSQKAKFTNCQSLKNQFHGVKCYLKAKKASTRKISLEKIS